MTSGLSALTIRGKDLVKLQNYENKLVRSYFKLRKNSLVIPLFMILGMEPVEVNLEREIFALFQNIWKQDRGPVFKMNKMLVKNDISRSTAWMNCARSMDFHQRRNSWTWNALQRSNGRKS